MRILIADDNRDAADALAILVEMWGHEVQVCYDGPSARDVALMFCPHMALLDVGMPQMSGLDLARALRTDPGGARVFLVALTGWGQPDDRRRSREAGFDHHLIKPAEPDQVEALLADIAGRLERQ